MRPVPAMMVAFGEYIADETASTLKQRDYKDATDIICFHPTQTPISSTEISHSLGANSNATSAVAFEPGSIARHAGPAGESDVVSTLRKEMGDNQPAVRIGMQVRRLTPVECERLQGFPDGYTDIKLKGKPTPDGPRYKALGNSMAVPVMNWIGKRIAAVNAIKNQKIKDAA
jgi:DNA (cytosine-5)-methyltransferase 1